MRKELSRNLHCLYPFSIHLMDMIIEPCQTEAITPNNSNACAPRDNIAGAKSVSQSLRTGNTRAEWKTRKDVRNSTSGEILYKIWPLSHFSHTEKINLCYLTG